MRTNIIIDDQLMKAALAATGLKTKKDVVEEGLRMLVRVRAQEGVRRLKGKINWEGDLDVMRAARSSAG